MIHYIELSKTLCILYMTNLFSSKAFGGYRFSKRHFFHISLLMTSKSNHDIYGFDMRSMGWGIISVQGIDRLQVIDLFKIRYYIDTLTLIISVLEWPWNEQLRKKQKERYYYELFPR